MILQLLFMIYLAAVSAVDAAKREVPLFLLGAGTVAAVGAAVIALRGGERSIQEIALGAVPGLVILLLAALTHSAGEADGIVLLQMEVIFSLSRTILAFGISLFLIAVFAFALLVLRKGKASTRLPYLPFLWLGGMISLCLTG